MKKRKWISIISLPYLPTFRFKAHNSNNSNINIKIKVKCSSPIINRILQSLFWLSLSSVTFSLPNRYDPRGVNSNSSKSQKIEERSTGRIFSLYLTLATTCLRLEFVPKSGIVRQPTPCMNQYSWYMCIYRELLPR